MGNRPDRSHDNNHIDANSGHGRSSNDRRTDRPGTINRAQGSASIGKQDTVTSTTAALLRAFPRLSKSVTAGDMTRNDSVPSSITPPNTIQGKLMQADKAAILATTQIDAENNGKYIIEGIDKNPMLVERDWAGELNNLVRTSTDVAMVP
jgi:hypothetical protein